MNVDDRPYPAPAVDSIDIGTETLVYDGEILHRLTDTGADIWRQVDGRISVAQIAAELAEGASDPPEDVHRDVVAFLDLLAEQGLLVTSDAGAAAGYRRPKHVGYVMDGELALLVDLRNGRRQALSATGTSVWELTCHYGEPARVQRLLRDRYPHGPVTLEGDVSVLLEQLCANGLLVPVGSDDGNN